MLFERHAEDGWISTTRIGMLFREISGELLGRPYDMLRHMQKRNLLQMRHKVRTDKFGQPVNLWRLSRQGRMQCHHLATTLLRCTRMHGLEKMDLAARG